MAEKTIPTTSDREPQKEINWPKRVRELIVAAFEGSVLKLIDNGITGLEGSPYLSTLIEDEEMDSDRDKFVVLCQVIQDLAEKLPEEDYSHVCGKLEKAEEMYYSRGHLGADKMAEILIHFYLQTHWNLPAFGTGSQRNTRQKVEQGGAAEKNGEQEEAAAKDGSAAQQRPAHSVLVAEGHLSRLGTIECSLVGLHGLLSEADKYAGVQCILEPIIGDLQRLTGDMHLFEERQKGGGA